MLDPHLRIPLVQSIAAHHRSPTSRTFVANMKLPDRHGVFTLLTDYRRQGLSWIEDRNQISITPLRHDEYPRFIKGAYPYYVTAGSMLAAWILFAGLWLSIKEDKSDKKKGKGVKSQ
jgi:oligosaccharyltransferase complex subunit beta